MAKLSITAAAKVFDVSRPTILKHLNQGKISGDKDPAKGWQIDSAELARVYTARPAKGEKALQQQLPLVANTLEADLKAEVERLKAELAHSQGVAEERLRQLDQLVPLLTNKKQRAWWRLW